MIYFLIYNIIQGGGMFNEIHRKIYGQGRGL